MNRGFTTTVIALLSCAVVLSAYAHSGSHLAPGASTTQAPDAPTQPAIPAGYAVVIGINEVDSAHYGTRFKQLKGCEADAESIRSFATETGYSVTKLVTKQATTEAVRIAIQAMSAKCKAGDIALIAYAGHGGQVPDRSYDEPDEKDETWVLYDRQFLDDELYDLLSTFASGVRLIVLSDSCHSGSIVRSESDDYQAVLEDRRKELEHAWEAATEDIGQRMRAPNKYEVRASTNDGPNLKLDEFEFMRITGVRALSPVENIEVYRRNAKLYDDIGAAQRGDSASCISASLLSISACKDTQKAVDLETNGMFTYALITVLKNDMPQTYRALHAAVRKFIQECQYTQEPILLDSSRDASLANQVPFVIR